MKKDNGNVNSPFCFFPHTGRVMAGSGVSILCLGRHSDRGDLLGGIHWYGDSGLLGGVDGYGELLGGIDWYVGRVDGYRDRYRDRDLLGGVDMLGLRG